MNDDQATRYFDELGSATDSRPPVADLLVAGRTADRRKRRRTIAASVVSVMLVLGGGTVAQQLLSGDGSKPAPDQVAEPLPTPDGMRLAAMKRVAVAVPASWGTQDTRCGQPVGPTVYFEERATTKCLVVPEGPVPSVQLVDAGSEVGQRLLAGVNEPSTRNGLEGLEGRSCADTGFCAAPPYVFALAAEGVVIALQGPAAEEPLLSQILDSLHLLPDGYTAVPFVSSGTMRSDVEAVMRDAGLAPSLQLPDIDVPIVGTDPVAGSVVVTGSTVDLVIPPSAAAERGPAIEGNWVGLLSGVTGGENLKDRFRDTTFSLSFDNGEMRGDDGCNEFGAEYTRVGQDLTFGPIESTKVGCDSTAAIVRVLNDTRHVTRDEGANQTYLHAQNWGIMLALRPASGADTCPDVPESIALESMPGSLPAPEGAVVMTNEQRTVAAWFEQPGVLPVLVVYDVAGERELVREDIGVGEDKYKESLRVGDDAVYFQSSADPDVWLWSRWERGTKYPSVYMVCS